MGIMILRTLFVYLFLLLLVYSMERKDSSRSTLADLVLIIMVVHLAIPAIFSTESPLFETLLPILVLFLTRLTFIYIIRSLKTWQTLLKRGQKKLNTPFPLLLIVDGQLQEENLKKIGKTYFWLKTELKKRTGTSALKQITLCRLYTDGYWHIDLKEQQGQKK